MRAIIRTLGLIVIGALFVLLGVPCAALADTTYVTNSAGSPSGKAMILASPSLGTWLSVVGPSSGSAVAYSSTISGNVSLNGTATLQADMDWSLASSKTITLSISYRRTGVDTLLCSNTFSISGTSSGTRSVTCATGAVSLTNADALKMTISVPALGGGGPDTFNAVTGSNTFVTWPQTMFFCPTAGNTCTCDGICNGNSCGTQFSTAQTTTCSCDCTVAGCTGLAISAPSPFTCTDALDASHIALTWGAVPGVTNYLLDRSAGNIYTGSTASFTDAPGVGNFTYHVKANGSCTPTIGGTTLSSKDSSLATANCLCASTGTIISIY